MFEVGWWGNVISTVQVAARLDSTTQMRQWQGWRLPQFAYKTHENGRSKSWFWIELMLVLQILLCTYQGRQGIHTSSYAYSYDDYSVIV